MSAEPIRGDQAWAPLRLPVFRALWIANMASNTGSWIHDVGASWLMTDLSTRPILVSLVQACVTLPVFVLALPAGALADVLDRRRILLTAQLFVCACALALALTTLAGVTTPGLLLAITCGLGIGTALTNPAWQSVVGEIVPREQLPAASGLSSVSINVSRALGPAIGGFVISAAGAWAAFALNAISFAAVVIVLARWRYEPVKRAAPGERFASALTAGVRYVRHSPPMKALLIRTGSFVLSGSALWALAPLVARRGLHLTVGGYGVLLTCLGLGALLGLAFMPRLRRSISANVLVALATVLASAALLALSFVREPWQAGLTMFVAGATWLTVVTSLNVTAQTSTPAWVRGRALACYLAIFFGGLALGSVTWGALAGALGVPATLQVAAAGLLVGLSTMKWFRLEPVTEADVRMSPYFSAPPQTPLLQPEQGPVVITVEYRIDDVDADAFQRAMRPIERMRRRDGAITWLLTRDANDSGLWLELFIVESWAEHLRQHERVTASDHALHDAARRFHRGAQPPRVSHLITR